MEKIVSRDAHLFKVKTHTHTHTHKALAEEKKKTTTLGKLSRKKKTS